MSDFLTDLREDLLDGLERYERRRWRRAPGLPGARRVAAVAAAAAAAVLAVLVADRPRDREQAVGPPVTRLEGFNATGIAAQDGKLWVAQGTAGQVLSIDLASGRIVSRTAVGGLPGTVLSAGGSLWVLDWDGRLVTLDPRTNRVIATLDLGQINGDIALAAGAIWAVGDRGWLIRIDPETGKITRRISLGPGVARPPAHPRGETLAAAGDTLWVATRSGVIEVDARSGTILGRASAPALPAEVARRTAADAGGLWLSSPTRREVLRIDARTRHVTRIRVPGDPGPLALVDGRLWVGTSHETGSLTRVTIIETDGHVAGSLAMPQPPVLIEPAPAGGAWVMFGENQTVSPAAIRLPDPR
jgi:outer membrane protein assembly factor BamB